MKTISTQFATAPYVQERVGRWIAEGWKPTLKLISRRSQRRAVKSWLRSSSVKDEIHDAVLGGRTRQERHVPKPIKAVEARVGVTLHDALANGNDSWFAPTVISMPVQTPYGMAYQSVCVAVCC